MSLAQLPRGPPRYLLCRPPDLGLLCSHHILTDSRLPEQRGSPYLALVCVSLSRDAEPTPLKQGEGLIRAPGKEKLAEYPRALFQIRDGLMIGAHSLVRATELEQAQRVISIRLVRLEHRQRSVQAVNRLLVFGDTVIRVAE